MKSFITMAILSIFVMLAILIFAIYIIGIAWHHGHRNVFWIKKYNIITSLFFSLAIALYIIAIFYLVRIVLDRYDTPTEQTTTNTNIW